MQCHLPVSCFMQPAHCVLEENLKACAAAEARVNHLVDSMRKIQERREACQKHADQLFTHIAKLEHDLLSAKQQAAAAQQDIQSADDQFQVLSQQCDAWEQKLEAILATVQKVKRRRHL